MYSTWGEYSDCSKSCGVGNKTRERNCIGGICSRATTQDLVQSDFCNEINCKLYGIWDFSFMIILLVIPSQSYI